ncbi:hypothetical protein WKI65_44040 [Streptomyces sp. MS1.AVA.3]|uniref:hypothetical protein n=1 Tax=Streptomyces decoyicus TaxID=249567 RepID=UPI0030C5B8C4
MSLVDVVLVRGVGQVIGSDEQAVPDLVDVRAVGVVDVAADLLQRISDPAG